MAEAVIVGNERKRGNVYCHLDRKITRDLPTEKDKSAGVSRNENGKMT